MNTFLAFLTRTSTYILGRISWQPPTWLHPIHEIPSSQRRRSLIAALLIFFVCLFATQGWRLFQKSASPDDIAVDVLAPALAEIGENGILPQPLRIDFSGSVARLENIDKPVIKGLGLEPGIKGVWQWEGDRSLAFYPEKEWAAGKTYHITLDKSLFAPGIRLQRYALKFESKPFVAAIETMDFYVNPKDPGIRQITAALSFSHAVDAGELKKALVLEGKGLKALLINPKDEQNYKIEMADFGRKAFIRSLPVKIPDEAVFAYLKLDKNLAPIEGSRLEKSLASNVRLPDLASFLRIKSSALEIVRNTDGDPEQTLLIETSLGVTREELQKKLSVYLLPKDRPGREGVGISHNHAWVSLEKVDEPLLKESEKLQFQIKASEQDYSELHAVTLNLPAKRWVFIKIEGKLTGLGGFLMLKPYQNVLGIPDYPRELRIMHEGAVLAQSGERTLSFQSRGINRVECRLGKVPAEQINHLVSQSEGNFQNPYFRNYSFGEDNLGKVYYQTILIDGQDSSKANYTALDFRKLIQDRDDSKGLFFLEISEQKEDQTTPQRLAQKGPDYQQQQSRWQDQKRSGQAVQDRRFVLITDLGILVKDNSDGTHEVFVQSIKTGMPVAGAEVRVLGKNGDSVAAVSTDGKGQGSLPRVLDFKREKAPVAFVVSKGADLSFLPYNRADRRLNVSRFDVGGVELADDKALTAFVFSDRGIYRPGDEMRLGLIVRSYDWMGKLEGLPLEVEITNPRGLVAHSQKFRLNKEGFLSLEYTPSESAPTGTYAVCVYPVRNGERDQMLGSTTVRVEEFLPDRMKIKAVLSKEMKEGWVSPQDLKIAVELNNLYGAAAVNRRVQGELTLTPSSYSFSRYPDYQFYDPDLKASQALRLVQESLEEVRTDEKGHAFLDLRLERFGLGVYSLSYLARGFEAEGGRSVAGGAKALVSARSFLIGAKPDGDLNYLRVGSNRQVGFLAVQPDLLPLAKMGLALKIFEQRYISALTKLPNGSYAYQSVLKEVETLSRPFDLEEQGSSLALPTKEPGDYILRLFDAEETCLSQVRFVVVGDANLSRSLEKNAELKVALSRQEYRSGEEISLSITAPYKGAGLITIERDKVYASKWFKTDSTASTQSITLPPGLEGNAYVNVTLLRSLDSKEIFASPLSTAVVPFRIDREKRTVQVKLAAPEKARPGDSFPITYKTDRPSKIVIYAVDEGILQVARYQLPDPLDHFLQKRALQVATSQIMDLILPEYSLARSVAAAGGDGGEDLLAANLNPFKRHREKPVVFWSGIVDAGTQEQTVFYRIPDYFNGSLRLMAVAVSEEAAGAAEQGVVVKGPFILQPNVPAFVAPGDSFEVSVSVANNEAGSGPGASLQLKLALSDNLELLKEPAMPLVIAEGGDLAVTYRLKAKNQLGNADLIFSVASEKETVRHVSSLSVRPSSPYLTKIRSGWFEKSSLEVPVERQMYPDYRKLEAQVSLLPTGFARGLKRFLDDYPHLCSEQLASRAFPTLLLDDESGSGLSREERAKALGKIIEVLRTRQNDQGAIGLWSARSDLSFDFPSVYVMHLLTEMKERGYEVPDSFFERGLGHLEQIAQESPASIHEARVQAYSIYLLTRNQKITTNYLNRLRNTLDRDYAALWPKDLTALYCAGSYQLLQNRREAAKVVGSFRLTDKPRLDYDDFYSDLSRNAQYLDILSRHFPEKLKSVSADDLLLIVEPLLRGDFTTHSAAYAVLGLRAYAESQMDGADFPLKITEKRNGGADVDLALSKGFIQYGDFSEKARSLFMERGAAKRVFYQVVEAGFDQPGAAPKPFHHGLEVQRDYRNKQGKTVETVGLGEEVEVRLRVRSIGHDYIENVAILDLLPGGFEVVGESIRQSAFPAGNEETETQAGTVTQKLIPDYVDVREDRVVVYARVEPEVLEFVYKMRATNRGDYQVPPLQAESMYRREIQSRGSSGMIKVEE